MPVSLPIQHAIPAQRFTVVLEGVTYLVRLVYRARTASWYLDLADETGAWLLRGRRLSPGSSPQAGLITNGPPGAFAVSAADPYDRHEIELWYFEESELLAAAPVDDDPLPVELA